MGHNRWIKIGLLGYVLATQAAYGCVNKGHNDNYNAAGCVSRTDTARQDTAGRYPVRRGPEGNTYLALGDSYTIGQSVTEAARYPLQAVARLNTDGDQVQAPEIIAETGWTTGDLLGALAAHSPSRAAYHVVTLLIGVNNQFQGRSLAEYRAQFTELLRQCIHWAGDTAAHVIVLSIPDYGASFYGQQSPDAAAIPAAIDEFNSVNGQVSRQYKVRYVYITDLTRQAKGDTSLFAPDGLHYSGKEMALWAARLAEAWPR